MWFKKLSSIVALDIDGVIFPQGKVTNPQHYIYSSYGMGALTQEKIDLIQKLTLITSVYWFTTWTDEANEQINERLGMRHFPVISLHGENTLSIKEQKKQGLLQWSKKHKNTQVIVLDDEVDLRQDRITTIKIDPDKGLLSHHVNQVQHIIESHISVR